MKEKFKIVKNPEKLDSTQVVQDLEEAIETLKKEKAIARFEVGDSMMPIFESGQYLLLRTIRIMQCNCTRRDIPQIGDAVFCCVNGCWMTRMVWMRNADTRQCLIGSASGEIYGWTDKILAIATPLPYKEVDNDAI